MSHDFISRLNDLKQCSPATLKAYAGDLSRFEDFLSERGLDLLQADGASVRAFLTAESRRRQSSSSVNRRLSTLRGFYSHAMSEGWIIANPMAGILGLRNPRTLPGLLFEEEIDRLLAIEGDDFRSVRDRAIFELLYSTGCRVAEVAALRVDRGDPMQRRIRVRGKGNKERFVFLGDSARAAVTAYLPLRASRIGPDRKTEQALFVNTRGTRLSTRGIFYLLAKRAAEAGITKPVHPHLVRHSFATHVLARGADIRIVQELLGHASLSTTQVYTHLSLDNLKDVYAAAHPHGRRRTPA